MFSISKLRLQQFYQKWKFLSSVYSFIISPGTLHQESVICSHLGILGPAFSGGTWVILFYYHRWKYIFPWCRRQKGCNPQSKAQGLAPLPGLAVVFTFWFPYYTPYCSYFPNSRGFWNVSVTNSKIQKEPEEWNSAVWSKVRQSKGIQSVPEKKYFLVRSKWTSFPEFSSIFYH